MRTPPFPCSGGTNAASSGASNPRGRKRRGLGLGMVSVRTVAVQLQVGVRDSRPNPTKGEVCGAHGGAKARVTRNWSEPESACARRGPRTRTRSRCLPSSRGRGYRLGRSWWPRLVVTSGPRSPSKRAVCLRTRFSRPRASRAAAGERAHRGPGRLTGISGRRGRGTAPGKRWSALGRELAARCPVSDSSRAAAHPSQIGQGLTVKVWLVGRGERRRCSGLPVASRGRTPTCCRIDGPRADWFWPLPRRSYGLWVMDSGVCVDTQIGPLPNHSALAMGPGAARMGHAPAPRCPRPALRGVWVACVPG